MQTEEDFIAAYPYVILAYPESSEEEVWGSYRTYREAEFDLEDAPPGSTIARVRSDGTFALLEY